MKKVNRNPLLDKLRSRMDSEVPTKAITSSTPSDEVLPVQALKPKESTGKAVPVAFSITVEEQSIIKSLRAWLLSQDIEATASQIVRACIASSNRNQGFVTVVQAIRSTDGRRKQDSKISK